MESAVLANVWLASYSLDVVMMFDKSVIWVIGYSLDLSLGIMLLLSLIESWSDSAALIQVREQTGLFFFLSHLTLLESDTLEPASRNTLQDEIPDEGEGTDSGADRVLLPSERDAPHIAVAELDNDDLDAEGQDQDHNENWVVENLAENV